MNERAYDLHRYMIQNGYIEINGFQVMVVLGAQRRVYFPYYVTGEGGALACIKVAIWELNSSMLGTINVLNPIGETEKYKTVTHVKDKQISEIFDGKYYIKGDEDNKFLTRAFGWEDDEAPEEQGEVIEIPSEPVKQRQVYGIRKLEVEQNVLKDRLDLPEARLMVEVELVSRKVGHEKFSDRVYSLSKQIKNYIEGARYE